jgi:hypothetical protein
VFIHAVFVNKIFGENCSESEGRCQIKKIVKYKLLDSYEKANQKHNSIDFCMHLFILRFSTLPQVLNGFRIDALASVREHVGT